MSAKFKSVALSAVMMAGMLAAGAVSAQIVVGGGSTLAEPLYDATMPSGVGNFNFSYTGVGSGAGKAAFLSNNATTLDNESLSPAPTPAVPLPNPWSSLQSVHLAGSDSALTSTELGTYASTKQPTYGPMIQIPVALTSVLVPYKRSGISDLNLTNAQMCAIFSNKTGGLTWGQLRGTTDATTVKVVYRLDSSGTTELLANYLVAACPGAGFTVSNVFTTVVAGAITGGVVPPSWFGVTGSGGMSSAMSTDSRIGYLSPDPVYTGSSNAVVSRINSNLPSSSAIQAVLGAKVLPVGGATSSPLAWIPAYQLPASGYPIFGTTNLLVNQCYKDTAVQTKVKNYVAALIASTTWLPLHNLINLPDGTGGTNNWKAAIASTFLTATSAFGIGNTSVCNTVGRPLHN